MTVVTGNRSHCGILILAYIKDVTLLDAETLKAMYLRTNDIFQLGNNLTKVILTLFDFIRFIILKKKGRKFCQLVVITTHVILCLPHVRSDTIVDTDGCVGFDV